MINQRAYLNILDENQRPITKCRVRIENQKERYERETDLAGIAEFLIPLGVYILNIEHISFKKKTYKVILRDSFSFTRIVLQKDELYCKNEEAPIEEHKENEFLYKEDKIEDNNLDKEKKIGDNSIGDFSEKEYNLKYYFDNEDFNNSNLEEENLKFDKKNNNDFDGIIKGAKTMLEEGFNFSDAFEADGFRKSEKNIPFDFEAMKEALKKNNSDEKCDDEIYDVYDYEEDIFDEEN